MKVTLVYRYCLLLFPGTEELYVGNVFNMLIAVIELLFFERISCKRFILFYLFL